MGQNGPKVTGHFCRDRRLQAAATGGGGPGEGKVGRAAIAIAAGHHQQSPPFVFGDGRIGWPLPVVPRGSNRSCKGLDISVPKAEGAVRQAGEPLGGQAQIDPFQATDMG